MTRTSRPALAFLLFVLLNGPVLARSDLDRFADTLINTATDEERAALLDANRQLVTVELRKKLIEKGNALSESNRFTAALTAFRLAQTVAERINDAEGVALAQFGFGYTFRALGNPDRALRHHQAALSRFEVISNMAQQALVLKHIGSLYLSQGSYKQAVESFNRQLALYEEMKDEPGVAGAYEDLASAAFEQENYALALEYYERCLKLREKIGNRVVIGATLKEIGNAHYYQQDFNRAIEYYKRALVILEERKDRLSEAAVLNSLGSSYYSQGEYDAALEHYQKGLAIEEEIRDRHGSATSLLGIGLVHYARGDFARALEHFHHNVSILESLQKKAELAGSLHKTGLAHFNLQYYDAALEYYRKSLAIFEEQKSLPDSASTLVDIGSVYFILGERDRTLEQYQKALAIYESLSHMPGVAGLHAAIAEVHFTERNLDLALEGFQKGLSLYESLGVKDRAAAMLNKIGAVNYAKGDSLRALEFSERATQMAREAGSLDVLWQARYTTGVAFRSLERKAEARKALEESVSIIDAMRSGILGSEYDRPKFAADKAGPYLALVELAAADGRPADAFNYAERFRALSLWDLLRSGRVRITRTMTPAEDEIERKLINKVVSLGIQMRRERHRRSPDLKRLAELVSELEKGRQEFSTFQRRLYATRPRLRGYRAEMSALRMEETARLIPDRKTALLSFTVTDAQTFLFVMTRPDRSSSRAASAPVDMRTYVLNVPFAELEGRVRQFRKAIADRAGEEAGAWLYDALLKPAEEQLTSKATLVIAPDGVLWDVPFHALRPEGGRYLIEDRSVVYAPSLTALGEMSRPRLPARSHSTELLAFANPSPAKEAIDRIRLYNREARLDPMPETEEEVKEVAALYGERASRVYTGIEAVEDHIKTGSGSSRIIHIAAPALLASANPIYSQVLMSAPLENNSQDGSLQVWEMMRLNLSADVSIFSACDYPKAQASGDRATGISWAMFVGGCATTVLGSRDEGGTAARRLMLEFHRAVGQKPRGPGARIRPAQALRRAALNLIKDKQLSHPYYWAGFFVMGAGY